jgi:GNAT superfamily N-acetyltransferase
MGVTYRLSIEPDAKPEDLQVIRDSLNEFNMVVTGDRNYRPLVIFVRDENDTIVGGVLTDIWGGWMHISYLWIAEPLRKQGYGKQLIAMAEDEARAQNCRGIYLETFDFQAPLFYQKLGYTVFGELADFPIGYSFYYLKKLL